MPRVFRRETFIALRARRTAYQIARDVLNPHVDITSVPCRTCGRDVPSAPDHLGPAARCPSCGSKVLLPGNYIAEHVDVEQDFDTPPQLTYRTVAPPEPTPGLTALHCVIVALAIVLFVAACVLFAMAIVG